MLCREICPLVTNPNITTQFVGLNAISRTSGNITLRIENNPKLANTGIVTADRLACADICQIHSHNQNTLFGTDVRCQVLDAVFWGSSGS